MDISRPNTAGPRPVVDSSAQQVAERAPVASPASVNPPAAARPDALRAALQALPDVDLDRVAALRQALQDGSLDTSPENLATDMLAFHRGGRH
ncbi:flagellar biosynthesis anti-sigma factor FlgM [Pseudomonas profundi]|uniref:flagellar biosynthesis anti-sigma factor FlgM n=1 Tax=Pseudomonas profundi TaxID=1981513 RepID=UPI00123B6A46|nr:flagellar biosynthesis anti-sigma factor FlgM [Pseudomonas profundi]